MEFLALDFETATPQADSPCELGIAVVRGGVVREVRNWLIKPRQWPYFSPWNVAVHGIRPSDVAEAPRWGGIWDEVATLLDGATVVAHNAAFDMSVLRSTLAAHNIGHPTFQYFCSVSMARKVWPGRASYGLKPMCDMHGIPLKHHRAGNDAEATAELVLRAADQRPSFDITQFLLDAKVNVGAFYPGGHRTPGGKVTVASAY
ncbi:MAG: 3'-5' exonuclease [Flavobacteriales bacterium]|jgi:DNA polymerase-3 subunit epsilon|nr:3'-5' exonuclease [Flavobacteriales bacterium]MBK7100307.1 3'-5' exonuclease [Flavobacteriales bacterium]MBK7481259.1 3'-5' exonuclease [Flavobacteriales bacterium]MBK8533468.1 3'-5' exonuclease [Flavobacteriales bacterium]MBK8707037.1 3'-5' exonuclease [Flavobacteriales bacterium]